MSKYKIDCLIEDVTFNVGVEDFKVVKEIMENMKGGMMRVERRKSTTALPEQFKVPTLPIIGVNGVSTSKSPPKSPKSPKSTTSRPRTIHSINLDQHVDAVFAASKSPTLSSVSPDDGNVNGNILGTSTFGSTFVDELMEFEDAYPNDQGT